MAAVKEIPIDVFHDNTLMPFGKYKGKALGSIPAQYFLWLYREGCDHTRLKKYIIENMTCFEQETKRRY